MKFFPRDPIFSPALRILFFLDFYLELFGPLFDRAEAKVSKRVLALNESADSSLFIVILTGEGFSGMSSGIRLMTLGVLSYFTGVLKSDL